MNKRTLIIIIIVALILSGISHYRDYLEESNNFQKQVGFNEENNEIVKEVYLNKLPILFPITFIWTFILIFSITWVIQKIFFRKKD